MAKKMCELCQESASDLRFGVRLCQNCLEGYTKAMSGDADAVSRFSDPDNFPHATEQAKIRLLGAL